MALIPKSELREIHGIDENDKAQIQAFIQGAVYCWIKNRTGEPFAARDLAGGENRDWKGTPLLALYEKHRKSGKDDEAAIASAGRDLGWLLKKVLVEDKRKFRAEKKGLVRAYRWVED